jgi:hypothetical protein
MAQRVFNGPKGFICLSFVASTGKQEATLFSCFKLQQQQKLWLTFGFWYLVFSYWLMQNKKQ